MALKPKTTQTPTTPTASPVWQNGGFCCALCNSPHGTKATPIAEDRSSVVYVIDLTTATPTVLDLFQYHSCEYTPRYTTTLNTTPQQCIDQFHKTFKHGSQFTRLVSGKSCEVGILTGNTADLLDLIVKCYQVLPQSAAANTIGRIRHYHALSTPTPPANKMEADKKTIIVFQELLDFVAEYQYYRKNRQSTELVVETHSVNQYSVRFVNSNIKFIIPKILIDKPRFSRLAGDSLVKIIKKSIIII